MKKLAILLMIALFALYSCDKDEQITGNEITLKKKPANNNNNGNGGNGGNTGGNAFWIIPDADQLTVSVGEIVQLAVEPVPMEWPEVEWYTNDQQICQAYWDGTIRGVQQGVTIISAFHYNLQGQTLHDQVIVTVQ